MQCVDSRFLFATFLFPRLHPNDNQPSWHFGQYTTIVFVNNYKCKFKHNWKHCTYCYVIVFSLKEYTFVRERVHSLLDYVRFNPLR